MTRYDKEVWNKEDIVKEVVKRTGYSEDKIDFIFDFLIRFIDKLTKKRSIISITFPHLGRLYLKNSHVKKMISILEARERKGRLSRSEAIRLSKYRTKLDELEKGSEKGTSKLKNHFTRYKIKNTYLTNKLSLEELENYQNDEK